MNKKKRILIMGMMGFIVNNLLATEMPPPPPEIPAAGPVAKKTTGSKKVLEGPPALPVSSDSKPSTIKDTPPVSGPPEMPAGLPAPKTLTGPKAPSNLSAQEKAPEGPPALPVSSDSKLPTIKDTPPVSGPPEMPAGPPAPKTLTGPKAPSNLSVKEKAPEGPPALPVSSDSKLPTIKDTPPVPGPLEMPAAPSVPKTLTGSKTPSEVSVSEEAPEESSKLKDSKSSSESVSPKVDKSAQVTSGIDFKKEEKKEEEDKDVIDTVDVKSAGGNWVFKNYWWRKIEEVYSKIKNVFNEIMTSRMDFFSKRSDVDKELDRFYQHVGLEQGPLEDIINLALDVMEKEKKEQGYLNKKERIFLAKVKDKQHQLLQLKEDVKAIEELDAKIDEALEVVLKQVNICSQYEQEVWKIFKNVARELSDKEARKQYYDTKGLLKDAQKIHEYLTGPFSSYFDQMVQGVQEHTQSIVAKLGALKNEQVDLKKEAEFFEQEDDQIEKIKAEKAKEDMVEKEVTSWLDSIKSWVSRVKNWFEKLWQHPGKTFKALWASTQKDTSSEFEKAKEETKHLVKEVKEEAVDLVQMIERDADKAGKRVDDDLKEAESDAKKFVHESENTIDKGSSAPKTSGKK